MNKKIASLAALFLASCGKPVNHPHEGVIAVSDDGTVDLISEAESVDFCKDKFCEPNYLIETEATSTSRFIDYARTAVNLEEAWVKTTGASVLVAVVDTGVDYTHKDLKHAITVNAKEVNGKPGVDDDSNGLIDDIYGYNFANDTSNPMDDNYHGTHCAGLVVANGTTSRVWGVSPNAKLLPVKVLNSKGAGTVLNGAKGIYYAVSRGAKVISLSWGTAAYSKVLNDAVQYAISSGVTVVAAAGNSGISIDSKPFFPASLSGVISVGSMDSRGSLSFFSNYGKSVTIIAPGSLVTSTTPKNTYSSISGTSMATPQVAGAVALKLSVNPLMSPSQIKDSICSSANKALTQKAECGTLNVGKLLK
jgi:subtilisin family serine protease